MSKYSAILLRFSMAGVFLWFGYMQLTDAAAWIGFLPEWLGYIPVSSEVIVQVNGWLEVLLAISMIAGVWTRVVAAILGVHLMGIAIMVGGATGVRDAGLALATLSLVLANVDSWTLDSVLIKRSAAQI